MAQDIIIGERFLNMNNKHQIEINSCHRKIQGCGRQVFG